MMDRDDHGQIELSIDDKIQWLNDRNIEIDIVSHYRPDVMCYQIAIIATFDRETYIEYKMVWN